MFIVIDGPDGSGKTTLAQQLVKDLCSKGATTLYTFEPTNESDAGKEIHSLLQSGNIKDIYSFTSLFIDDRKHHIHNLILPALNSGVHVVCDRYKYSSMAYQQSQGVCPSYLININADCLIPDVVFLLLPKCISTLMSRISNRQKNKDFFETAEYLNRIIVFYKKIPEYFPDERIIYLDAESPISENIIRIEQMIGIP